LTRIFSFLTTQQNVSENRTYLVHHISVT